MAEKTDLVVTRVKETIESGSFKPGQVITTKDIIGRVPEVFYGSVGVTINKMARAGLLKLLGDKQLEVTEDFAIMTVQEAIDLVNKAGPGERKPYTKRSVNVEEPVAEERESFVEINFLEGLSQLTDAERREVIADCLEKMPDEDAITVINYCVGRLAARAGGFAKDVAGTLRDINRLEAKIEELQNERKDLNVTIMDLREELSRTRGTSEMGRLAERRVVLETKPVDLENRNIQSGGSGNIAGGFVVHRKPLMGHTPKVIRRHSVDPEKKE